MTQFAASLAVVSLVTWLLMVDTSRAKTPSESESDQLADLEQQINNLQLYPALFKVVDPQDNSIFEVTSSDYWSSASVLSSDRRVAASMNADKDGGYFFVLSADGYTKARLGIDQTWAGLRISEGVTTTKVTDSKGVTTEVVRPDARLELGGFATANYSLRFPSSGGLLAGIGESKAGTGAIVIGDSKGRRRASMFVGEDSKGLIGIYDAAGEPIAVLGEASGNTGGALVLGDAKGDPKVKIGTNDNRYGVVMTFPSGFPYLPKSGLPGSYMLGCAPGPACQ